MAETGWSRGSAATNVHVVAVRGFAVAAFILAIPLWGIAISEGIVEFGTSLGVILPGLAFHAAIAAAPWPRLLGGPTGAWLVRGYLAAINGLLVVAYVTFDVPWPTLLISALSLVLTGVVLTIVDHVVATAAVLALLAFGQTDLDPFSLAVVLAVVTLGSVALVLEGRSLNAASRELDAERERGAAEAEHLREVEDRREHALGMIVHEIKNRLNIVMGSAETLRTHHGQLTPDRLDELATVAATHARATNMIIEGLELLVTAERLDPSRFESVDVAEIASRVVEAVRAEADTHRVRLEIPTDVRVETDPALFGRVLENLVVNAVTHTPAGTEVTVSARPAGNNTIRISVDDDGPGTPEEARDRLTEAFYRLEGSAGHAPGGLGLNLGLGLTIVSRFLRAQGSTLEVSEPTTGTGAVFSFELPRSDRPAGNERPNATA